MERYAIEQSVGPGFVDDLGLSGKEGSLVDALTKTGELSLLDWLTLRDLMRFADSDDEALALLIVLTLSALSRGSLCLKLDVKLLQEASRLVTGEPFAKHCKRIVDETALIALDKSRWNSVIGNSIDDVKPMILQNSGDLYMYFQKHLVSALALQNHFLRRLDSPRAQLVGDNKAREILERVLGSQKVCLNNQQQLAAAMSLLQSFTVISGGPGTGKTSIIVVLLQCFLECGINVDEIAVVAPTGRAAQRTTESIHNALPEMDGGTEHPLRTIKGTTIHSLLRYSPKENGFSYNASRLLPHKVVVVDEVSMVDTQLMASLMDAVQDSARILFLGDKDQLPSVEAGAVLAELIPPATQTLVSDEFADAIRQILPDCDVPSGTVAAGGLNDRTVVLTQSYRSEQSILEVAASVNAGDVGVVDALQPVPVKGNLIDFSGLSKGAYVAEIQAADTDSLHYVLDSWAACRYARDRSESGWLAIMKRLAGADFSQLSELGKEGRELLEAAFSHLEQGQILTLLRSGAYGVHGINHYLGSQIRQVTDPGSRAGYFHGEPVIVRQNTHSLGLSNGDLGIVLKGTEGVYRVVFRQQNDYVGYAIDSIPALEPAFAITVHKSQGSEYGDVLLVLPPKKDNPLLSKEILYTGVTRARGRVCIAGSRSVISAAVDRTVQRETGIDLWAVDGVEPASEAMDFTDLPLFQ